MESTIQELIQNIVVEICDFKNDVDVKEIPGDASSIIEIHVNKKDQGKVIGKGGKVIQAIRTIVYTISYRSKKRYNIEVIGEIKE